MSRTRSSSSPAEKKSRAAKPAPTAEEIARRAYFIHLERGGTPGNQLEDWLRAERELLEESKKSKRKPKVVSIAAA